jgi:hypothetical protein
MTDTPIDERKFTDREVREILKKAVERAPSGALMKSEGLSLAELKSIGQEVGIDPARLEDAARSVVLGGGNQPNRFLGAPTVLTFDRKVQGEIGPEHTPEILARIRRIMGQHGEVDEIHGSLEWSTTGESGERFVTISSRDGATTIQGSANLHQAAIVTFLPIGILGVLGAVIGSIVALENGSPLGFVFGLSILPILYPALRTIFRKVTEKEATKLQQVVDELARLTEGSGE